MLYRNNKQSKKARALSIISLLVHKLLKRNERKQRRGIRR